MSAKTHLKQQYSIFVNAFSYTIASSILTSTTNPDSHSPLVIALALSVGLVFLSNLVGVISASRPRLEATLAEGPLDLLLYLATTASSVLVNFLSISLGRWALAVNVEASNAMLAIVAGTGMLWLVGEAAGLQ